jgi:Xaa-Pro aminopeptidase
LAVHAERRRQFLESMAPDSVAFLVGAAPVTRSADTEYPFRQNSDFWYLTGFDHPNAVAVIRKGAGPTYSLFVEPRDRAAETWTGYRPGLEGARSEHGADEAYPCEELLGKVPELIAGARRIYHHLGRNEALDARLVATLDEMRLRSRAGRTPASEWVDPREIIHEMRLHKSDAELELMRRAAAITAEAHHEAARIAREGHHEYELEAVLDYTFRRRGGTGPAYTTIVGGGRNATILHYIANDQPLRDGELVLIDAGCECEGYAADVTRTYPVGGRYEGARRDLYEVVLSAQLASLEVARPGATLVQVHDASVEALVKGMADVGLLSGDPAELIAAEAYRPYYMHNTSHWLGLDVHDVGTYREGGEPRSLEPGMCFTIEPGLYVPADAEDADPRFRGVGIRIEDDVVITDTGHENLTAAIPKRPDDVEAWMREA